MKTNRLKTYQISFNRLTLHQLGQFATQMPGSTFLRLQSDRIHVETEHEYLSQLHFDGKLCINNMSYRLDYCRNNYIHNVSLKEK